VNASDHAQPETCSHSSTAPDPLTLNLPLVQKILVGFVRNEVRRTGLQRVVFGLSGGIDSTLAAYIAAEALGPENVLGVRMPYSSSSSETMDHGQLVADRLGIHIKTLSITTQVDGYFTQIDDEASRLRRANMMARQRMTVLYDQSADFQALVLGTSNKTELLLGYGTLHGDMASALNPIGDLYKSQIWALSEHMGVPAEIVKKPPTADLWAGQTDEAELGFTYAEVDNLLVRMIDHRLNTDQLIAEGFAAAFIERVSRLVRTTQFKRRLPLIAKLGPRTIDRDFRYSRDWGT
jgi:NAD+ synthase